MHRLFSYFAWQRALLISLSLALLTPGQTVAEDAFKKTVQPALKMYCYQCHGPALQEADLRIDTLNPDMVRGNDAETWHDILNKLNLGEMPPQEAKQLPAAARQAVTRWMTEELRRAAREKRSTDGEVVLRRMTTYEYNNTMRDLLGVNLNFAANLPPDPPSATGFKNNGASLGISPLHLELYLKAARRGLNQAIVTGEKPTVHRKEVAKSDAVRRKKGDVTSQLQYGDRFIFRTLDFPREGEILVRIHASATPAKPAAEAGPGATSPHPQLRIAMGLRADTRAPEANLATVDITTSANAPRVYEFRPRIEDFPLPGKNPKFPGFQITLYHDAPKGVSFKRKKQKKGEEVKLDETQPTIHIEKVEFEGPYLPQWPPASHMAILFESENRSDEASYAREVIQRFITRAYRKPAAAKSVDALMKYYRQIRPDMESLELTMREVLAMSLVSPEFLYLTEPHPQSGQKLDNYELATRLSYFLWSTMPDQPLFDLAAAGKLTAPEVMKQQVARMLADPKCNAFVRHFTSQWLDLAAVDRVAVNPDFHPGFDDQLKADMQRETQLFFGEILHSNASCMQLLDARFAMLNHRLAKHYGLKNPPPGVDFQRVALPEGSRRGGLLTQGAFLLANSNGEDSHPIKRAVWVLDRLLDSPPAPPPPDVPDLDPSEPDLAGLSLKRQLEVHRKKESCNNCHRGIDPWGIAFEHYDATGRYREKVTAPRNRRRPALAVEATATLPSGDEIDGVEGLKQHLLEQRKNLFAAAIVKKLLTYALGRDIELQDRDAVEQLTEQFARDGYRLQDLIAGVAVSQPFQTK